MKSGTNFTFSAQKDGMVMLDIYSSDGRRITQVFRANVKVGEMQQVYFPTQGLPAGLYFGVLRTGDNVETIKLMIMD